MIKLTTCCPIVGSEFLLNNECVDNWEDVAPLLSDTGACVFTVIHNQVEYTGVVGLSTDGLVIMLGFDQTDVILPKGVCFDIECPSLDPTPENPEYCDNTAGQLDDDTKLAILDEEGCPAGYVLYSDLKADILDSIKDDLNFCDFFPNGIPEGDLVVSDRILTVSSPCSLKSVPQSDIACE